MGDLRLALLAIPVNLVAAVVIFLPLWGLVSVLGWMGDHILGDLVVLLAAAGSLVWLMAGFWFANFVVLRRLCGE